MQITEDILRAAKELELRARRNLTALLAGNYRSIFRGSGMQFKEFRRYEPGDDIRHMSWTATARTRKPILKVYEEERELDVLLMVDVSGSSVLGPVGRRRLDRYAELTALLGLAAIRAGDNLGLLLFTDRTELYLPPRRTREHLLSALSVLLAQPLHERKSDLRPPLRYAEQILKHRSLILVLSDFLTPGFDSEVARLSRRHEIILVHCYDDVERGANLDGVYEVCDPETGEFYVLDGLSRRTRDALATNQARLRDSLETLCRNSRADYLGLGNQDDYLLRLIQFFRRRGPARI